MSIAAMANELMPLPSRWVTAQSSCQIRLISCTDRPHTLGTSTSSSSAFTAVPPPKSVTNAKPVPVCPSAVCSVTPISSWCASSKSRLVRTNGRRRIQVSALLISMLKARLSVCGRGNQWPMRTPSSRRASSTTPRLTVSMTTDSAPISWNRDSDARLYSTTGGTLLVPV